MMEWGETSEEMGREYLQEVVGQPEYSYYKCPATHLNSIVVENWQRSVNAPICCGEDSERSQMVQ